MRARTGLNLLALAVGSAGMALSHAAFAGTFTDAIALGWWWEGGSAALLLAAVFWWHHRRKLGNSDGRSSLAAHPGQVQDETPDAKLRPRPWIPLGIFLGIATLIGVFGWVFYRHERLEHRTIQENQLAAIADFKRQQIEAWLGERRRAAMTWRKGSIFGEVVVQWLAGNGKDRSQERQIEKRLWTIKEFLGYTSVALLDGEGRVRLRVGAEPALSPQFVELSRMAMASGQVQFSDLYRMVKGAGSEVNMDFIAPLSGLDSERPAAVLAFTTSANEFLFPLIQSWPLPSGSAETVLVRREAGSVLFLNALRHHRDAAFNLSFPLSNQALLAVRAVEGQQGIATGQDYRGVRVLASITGIAGTPWRLIAKVDVGEIDAPARRDAAIVTGTCLALMLAAGTATALAWRRRRYALESAYQEERAKRAILSMRLDDLARDATDIILLTDGDGNIRDANQRAIDAYGQSHEALCGLSLLDLVPPELRAAAKAEWNKAVDQGQARFETLHRSWQGGDFPVEVNTRRIGYGDVLLMQSVIRDISERRRVEAEIRRLSELGRVLSRCNPCVLSQVGPDGFLGETCRLVVRHGGFAMACAYGGMGRNGEPMLLAYFGNHPGALPVVQTHRGTVREVADEVRCARDGGPAWFPDARGLVFRLPWLGETPLTGFGCYAAVPIAGEPGLTGALLLFGGQPEPFSQHVEPFLERLAENTTRGLELLAQREALRSSRDRLGAMLDNIDGVVWSLDPYTFDLVYTNPSIARMTGYAAEVMLAQPGLWRDMLLPGDRIRLMDDLNQAKLTGALGGDYQIMRLDGHRRWVNIQGRMVFDANGRPQRLDGIAFDITERRLNEIANEAIQLISAVFLKHRQASEPYRQVAELLAQRLEFPMVCIDLYNPLTERMESLGCSIASDPVPQAVGESITATVSARGTSWYETDLARNGGDPGCEGLRQLGGRSFIAMPLWIGNEPLGGLLLADTAPRPDIGSWQIYLCLIASRLAMEMDRRRRTRGLDRQAQEFRQLLDSLFIYAGILTPEGMVIDINRTALETVGLRLEDVQGRPFEDTPWWSASEASQQRLREALTEAAQGRTVRYDTQIQYRPGDCATIDFGITPIFDAEGQVTYLVPSALDISERCRVQEEARRQGAWLRAGIDRVPIGLMIVDPRSGRLQKANQTLCQFLGYREEALLGMAWLDLLMPLDHETHRQGIESLLRGAVEAYTAREHYRHCNGDVLPFLVEIRYGRYADADLDALMATLVPSAMEGPPP